MVSACVLISMSTGTMATNSKEKVHVCVFVCLFTGPIHWLFVHMYVIHMHTYMFVGVCVHVCMCVNVHI